MCVIDKVYPNEHAYPGRGAELVAQLPVYVLRLIYLNFFCQVRCQITKTLLLGS